MSETSLKHHLLEALKDGPQPIAKIRPKVAMFAASDRAIYNALMRLQAEGLVLKIGAKWGTTYQLKEAV